MPNSQQIQQVAADTSWLGAIIAAGGAISASTWIGLLGVGVAFVGVVVNASINAYFKHKEFQLRRLEHERKMRGVPIATTQPGDLLP